MALAYKVSDIVVSASIEPEAFGRVAVEAQSMEKMIIASDIGGSNETIINEKTGLLFESGDANSLSKKIIKAISPDIISFQENSLDNLTLKSLLDTWLPLNNSNGWYVNFNTASKWEITNQWTNFRDLNPPANSKNIIERKPNKKSKNPRSVKKERLSII